MNSEIYSMHLSSTDTLIFSIQKQYFNTEASMDVFNTMIDICVDRTFKQPIEFSMPIDSSFSNIGILSLYADTLAASLIHQCKEDEKHVEILEDVTDYIFNDYDEDYSINIYIPAELERDYDMLLSITYKQNVLASYKLDNEAVICLLNLLMDMVVKIDISGTLAEYMSFVYPEEYFGEEQLIAWGYL